VKELKPPLSDEDVAQLRIGEKVWISGVIYSARDTAHKRITEALKRGEHPPIPLKGQIIYYMGPTPARPGRAIGAAGPTTALRMDPYLEPLLRAGLKATIGKGYRSWQAVKLLEKYKAVYLLAIGGAGALLSRHIKKVRVVAYEDLGVEAVRELWVERFPALVANDIYGGDLFEEGVKRFRELSLPFKPSRIC